jgi:hypothetical protein
MGLEVGGGSDHGGASRRRFAAAAVVLAMITSLTVAPSALAATSVTATIAKLGDVGYVVTVDNPAAEPISFLTLASKHSFDPGSEVFVMSSIAPASCKHGSLLPSVIGCSGFSSGSLSVCYAGPATTSVSIQFAESNVSYVITPTTVPATSSCPIAGFVPPPPVPKPGHTKKGSHHKKKHKKRHHRRHHEQALLRDLSWRPGR